jgi:hypothetical protein
VTHVVRISTTLLERDVTFEVEGEGQWEDYGVPGSPRWLQIDVVSVTWPVVVDELEYESAEALEEAHPGMEAAILEHVTESAEWDKYEEEDYDE